MKSDFEEKTLHRTQVYKGKVIELCVDTVMLPNEKKGTRELIFHNGAVCVLIVNPAGKIVFVRQYRKALEQSLLELPAGKLEVGENPREAVMREMNEEVGYTCSDVELLYTFYGCPGFCNEKLYLYRAIHPELAVQKLEPDEDEFVEQIELDIKEAFTLLEKGEIQDGKTIMALQYLYLEMLKNRSNGLNLIEE